MKSKGLNRREIVEHCIVKGLLVAGVPMSASNLFALWEKSEKDAMKPTPEEVLGTVLQEACSECDKPAGSRRSRSALTSCGENCEHSRRAGAWRPRGHLANRSSRPIRRAGLPISHQAGSRYGFQNTKSRR